MEKRLLSSPSRDFCFNGFDWDTFLAIQLSESVLNRLTKFQFVNGIGQRRVGRKFFCDFDQDLLRAHTMVYRIAVLGASFEGY